MGCTPEKTTRSAGLLMMASIFALPSSPFAPGQPPRSLPTLLLLSFLFPVGPAGLQYRRYHLSVGSMTQRDPIHLGSGEPMFLLHPFMLSQGVWKCVAPQIATTGRYEVSRRPCPATTAASGQGFLDTAELADDMERRMDALGWGTAHIVGNSLGGWVAFELERRGRARTLTGIAPAGGWRWYTPAKFEIVFKFVAGFPVWLVTKILGERALKLPFAKQLGVRPDERASPTPSTTPTCPRSSTTSGTARRTTSCW